MTTEQMRDSVKKLVTVKKAEIKWMEDENRIKKGELLWQDCIYEDSGVDIKDEAAIDNLTYEELKKIAETWPQFF